MKGELKYGCGPMLRMDMCQRFKYTYIDKAGSSSEKGLGGKIMKQLTDDLKNTYWHVCFDNFSASVDLALDLHRAGLYSCATLRTNRRHYPGDLKVLAKKGLKEGDSRTIQNDHLL